MSTCANIKYVSFDFTAGTGKRPNEVSGWHPYLLAFGGLMYATLQFFSSFRALQFT